MTSTGHGGHVVLLRAQPRGGVLEDDAEPALVGVVGAAAVPHRAHVEHDRPGGHRGRDGVGRPAACPLGCVRWLPGTMTVAPLSIVKSSSAHIVLSTTCWCGHGIGYTTSSRCSPCGVSLGPDVDAHRSAQLVVAEHPVEHAEQQRVGGQLVEAADLREQRVDPLCDEPLEVVAAERVGVPVGRELRP